MTGTTTGTATDEGPDGPGYEEARAELVDVVRRLEAGGTTLEESLALWERGELLARTCEEWLDGARRRLDAVLDAEGGDPAGAGQDPSGDDEG